MNRSHRHHFLDRRPADLPDTLRRHTTPLRDPDDLDPLLNRIGDARVVMLGEATHGTSEFYTTRAEITRRLIEEKGFSFVAVEGDWPDCYRLNRFVKGYDNAGAQAVDAAASFERWPTWMWANWEIVALLDWMRRHNRGIEEPTERVGFFGLDVYSLRDSLTAVLNYLQHTDSKALDSALRAMRCFEPHGLRGVDYAQAHSMVDADCRDEVADLLARLHQRPPSHHGDLEAELDLRQNVRVAVSAEHYYRTMLRAGPDSWNIRDRHMTRTLDELLDFHGSDSRAVVWEHNTHIGDARYTDMDSSGMVNVGQLARQRFGDDEVVLVGFSTHRGHAIAGHSWGAEMEEMVLPEALTGSWEDVFHRIDADDRLLICDDIADRQQFLKPRGHRAIGVVYRSGSPARGNYVPTVLPRRYDAVIHIDHSRALHPLHIEPQPALEPELYPWGM